MSEPLVSRQAAIEHLRRSDQRWAAAVQAFNPYAARLRNLAEAAEDHSRVLTLADLANVEWNPRPGASKLRLAYGLEEGSGRPGPRPLWSQFDKAVKQLGLALEGDSMAALARAFGQLSSVAAQLADASETEVPEEQRHAG
ncbi:MAG TPA: hypothetical protein VGL51_20770 [Solirubrobacteraceae bacterium]